MKNKSKRALFAVMLLALLLIMLTSAFAAVEEKQEIGVPQAMEVLAKGCFGAVLSPDGDRFYTLREGWLTQYKINPLKKIDSVAIDWEPLVEKKYGGCFQVLLTNDKSKLVIFYYDRMFLLDASTGQVLNKFERTELGRSIEAAVLNDNDLVMLERFSSGDDQPVFYNLAIWDANTLKLKRDIRDLGKSFGYVYSGGPYPTMSKIRDRIYMTSGKSLVVLNSKTYMPELTISQLANEVSPKISKNFQKLYIANVSEVTDHLNGKHTNVNDLKVGDVSVFDQETREFRIVNVNSISRDEFDAYPYLVGPLRLSRNKEYVMLVPSRYVLLRNLNTGMMFKFYQYEGGEAIQQVCSTPNECREFQLTPGVRKYLMMKNKAGKIVPINDATFSMYYQPGELHQ